MKSLNISHIIKVLTIKILQKNLHENYVARLSTEIDISWETVSRGVPKVGVWGGPNEPKNKGHSN